MSKAYNSYKYVSNSSALNWSISLALLLRICRFRNDFDDDDDPSSFEADLATLCEMEAEMKDSESQESVG